MAEESDLLPDDGSVSWESLDLSDAPTLAHAWLGGLAGLAVYPSGETIAPVFLSQVKEWEGEEPEPEGWEDAGQQALTGLHGLQLAWLRRTVSAGSPDAYNQAMRMRWRIAWPLVDEAVVWPFAHLVYRILLTQLLDAGPTPATEVSRHELWWKGATEEEREAYDAEDPNTWPGTPWVEPALPAVDAPAEPVSGDAVNEAAHRFRWIWPRAAMMGTRPYLAEGLIPGGKRPGWEYERVLTPVAGAAGGRGEVTGG